MKLSFVVYTTPVPQGSMKAFMPKGWKHPVLTSDNKNLKSFRQQVSIVALASMRDVGAVPIPSKNPVSLKVRFYFKRPKSKSKKAFIVVKPDLDKICRAIFDSLTGILFRDDSQITNLCAEKCYGQPERAEIEVEG